MNPEQRRKLLHQLTGAYLAHPRPADWLAAAVIYQDECDGGATCGCGAATLWPCGKIQKRAPTCAELAAMWRARGLHYDAVMEAHRHFRIQIADGYSPIWSAVGAAYLEWNIQVGGVAHVSVHRRTPGFGSKRVYPGFLWQRSSAEGEKYRTRRAIQLIDAHRALLMGEGG